ncbi:MAG: DUF4157 domain-containing protein [Chloroflexi bacterium]|nr:DUF4157 domain-containing protein [Chloroflexota bacterium]
MAKGMEFQARLAHRATSRSAASAPRSLEEGIDNRPRWTGTGPILGNQAMQEQVRRGGLRAVITAGLGASLGNQMVQRLVSRAGQNGDGGQTDENIGERIRSAASRGGAPLEQNVQRRLETALGADLSGVRIHADGEADQLSRSVDAIAFTTGSDIFFRAGSYNPSTSEGFELLAHEATHTIQQARGPVAGTPAPGGILLSDPGDSFEQAAAAAARRISQGSAGLVGTGPSSSTTGSTVQRAATDEEETVQTQRRTVQRAGAEEEEPEVQTARTMVQRAGPDEEEPVS